MCSIVTVNGKLAQLTKVWATGTMSQITRLLSYAFEIELFFKRFRIKKYEFLKIYDCIYRKYGMNLLQTPRVQKAVFAFEQILHPPPPLTPSSLYYSNNDIDTKRLTTWCVGLLEKATVTLLVNILTGFAKHRIVVHGRVPKGSVIQPASNVIDKETAHEVKAVEA